ncbi:MAG: tail fiber domain-containing protein, partial [Planctomycetota bacterium]
QAGTDSIIFDIPGVGPHVIIPVAPLPNITDAVNIDGYTQTGSKPNELINGCDAILQIVLDGSSSTGSGNTGIGLWINADDVIIRGLVINQFPTHGIVVQGDGHVIQGNFIGTDAAGSVAQANGSNGIYWLGGSNLTIGGNIPAARNLISGNNMNGISLTVGAANVVVQGNFIGVDALGKSVIGNGDFGIVVNTRIINCLIGGTSKGASNVISGNTLGGVYLGWSAIVQGNYIGTDMAGQLALGNGSGPGVWWFHAGGSIIGGTEPGAGNMIAYNDMGIATPANASHSGVSMLGNSIFGSTRLGIDLRGDGVTPNDEGDVDTGANNLQNYPLLLSVQSDGVGVVDIEGILDSTADSVFLLEFFDNTTGDPTGFGEGEKFIGRANVLTDSDGFAYFVVSFSATVPLGHVITSTATADDGSTSEFSPWVAVEEPNEPETSTTAFYYQGKLKENNREVDGLFDFEFGLYDKPVSGTLLKQELLFDDVSVVEGIFNVPLDFGRSVFTGQARYLEISIRPGASSNPDDFVTLQPRQLISSTPYALQTRGIFVDDASNVGIGTSLPTSPLTIAGIIESTSGGFKFPDGTTQTTAAQGDPQIWQSDGINTYYLGGNVGIGTSVPSSNLHLRGFLDPAVIRFETSFLEGIPPTTDSTNPAAVVDSSVGMPWSDMTQALIQDYTYATVVLSESAGGLDFDVSKVLTFSDFGFNLPTGATVTGIVVQVDGAADCNCLPLWPAPHCDRCRLPMALELLTDESASLPRLMDWHPCYEGLGCVFLDIVESGSDSDNWGLPLTPAVINSSAFSIRLHVELVLEDGHFLGGYTACDGDGIGHVDIDSVTIMVFYYESTLQESRANWSIGLAEGQTSFRISPDSNLSTDALTIDVDGNIIVKSVTETSSRKHKRNIRNITGALEKVSALQGIFFDWDPEHGGQHDMGFVGEDVANVLPELVHMNSEDGNVGGLKYGHLTAVIVEAIKELNTQKEKEIAALKTQNKQLQRRIEVLEQILSGLSTGKD